MASGHGVSERRWPQMPISRRYRVAFRKVPTALPISFRKGTHKTPNQEQYLISNPSQSQTSVFYPRLPRAHFRI